MKRVVMVSMLFFLIAVVVVCGCVGWRKIYAIALSRGRHWPMESPPLEISFYEDLLSVEEAKQIIHYARPRLQRSTVASKNRVEEIRTSTNTSMPPMQFPSTARLSRFISGLAKLPITHFEDIQIVHYKPGQHYGFHWDACPPIDTEATKICKEVLDKYGTRRYTFFIYLNHCEEGGETAFSEYKDIRGKPKLGNGLLWRNTFVDKNGNEITNYNTRHAGLPVKKGEKWGMNFWIRTQPFVPSHKLFYGK